MIDFLFQYIEHVLLIAHPLHITFFHYTRRQLDNLGTFLKMMHELPLQKRCFGLPKMPLLQHLIHGYSWSLIMN